MIASYISPSLTFFNLLVNSSNPEKTVKTAWPQLREIVALVPERGSSTFNELELWFRALHWQYLHPHEPWEKETEQLFCIAFEKSLLARTNAEKSTLLRLWTKHGTVVPCEEGQTIIGSYLDTLDSTHGIRMLQFGLLARHWMQCDVLESWLKSCVEYTSTHSTPAAFSTVAYMLGLAETNNAQKKTANPVLSGSSNDYPISFAYAPAIGEIHPDPITWACEMLDLSRSIGLKRGYNEDLQLQARKDIHHLEPMFDRLSWEHPDKPWTMAHTKALLFACEIESTGNPMGMDIAAWNVRAPNAWPFVKSTMSLLDSMGWVEDPSLSRPTLALIEQVHQLVVPFLENKINPQVDRHLPLPSYIC